MSRTSDSKISKYTENMDKILRIKFNEVVLNGTQIRKLFGQAKKM